MPTAYRSMKQADDGLPVVGSKARELGVRVPPNPNPDVNLDGRGHVLLDGNGMSVAEHWRYLLPHLIPKRLHAKHAGATGSNVLACYRMGEGPFAPGELAEGLEVLLKAGDRHRGNVVPAEDMHVSEFLKYLAATREMWQIDKA